MPQKRLAQLLTRWKRHVGVVIILTTAAIFTWYLTDNPDALNPLKSVSAYVIPVILLFYGLFLITNYAITTVTITISGKSYPVKDTIMLTIYSTLVNFFGPLQSGPGFRAVYLKKKIGLSIKDYTLVTLLYYAAFFLISAIMMLGPTYPLPTAGFVIFILLVSLWSMRHRNLVSIIRNFSIIGIITLVQVGLVATIYYIELRAVGYVPSLTAILAYAGSANLALFVAFTPGAIGIRESFIYFTQSLHQIPTDYIVSASLLDRSVYIIFLGILFIASSSLHIKSRLTNSSA